jgi:hypothetical protein
MEGYYALLGGAKAACALDRRRRDAQILVNGRSPTKRKPRSQLAKFSSRLVVLCFSRLLLPPRRMHACMLAHPVTHTSSERKAPPFGSANVEAEILCGGGNNDVTTSVPHRCNLSVMQSRGWVTDRRRFRRKLLLLRQRWSTSTSQCPCRYRIVWTIQKAIQSGSENVSM